MDKKFSNIRTELDTTIYQRRQIKFGKYDAVYEIWSWDGVEAESLIFITDELDIGREELKEKVKESEIYNKKLGSDIVIKVTSFGHTFVNFNFVQKSIL